MDSREQKHGDDKIIWLILFVISAILQGESAKSCELAPFFE